MPVRTTAIIAARNEAAYIGRCCRHLAEQGIRFVLVDNESSDDTRAIAESFRHRGLLKVVTHPYPGYYDWTGILKMKEQIARELDADWYLHLDADEIPEPPERGESLVERLSRVDAAGFNAVNFDEFVFVPESETDHHEGGDYVASMFTYYFHQPRTMRLVRAWRRHAAVDLATSGGHDATFPGRVVCPDNFVLRHYIALSMQHLRRKYSSERVYSAAELARGWHRARSQLAGEPMHPPPRDALFDIRTDRGWNRSTPQPRHLFFPDLQAPSSEN